MITLHDTDATESQLADVGRRLEERQYLKSGSNF